MFPCGYVKIVQPVAICTVIFVTQADGIRRADGTTAMAVAPPRVCVLMAGLSWVP